MAQHVFDKTFKAENDLSTKQFYIVELSGFEQVDVCDGAGDKPLGVLRNKPKAGAGADVRILGISEVVSDGSGTAISVGDDVGTNGSGKAVKKTTNNDLALGIALSASSADGTIINVLLTGIRSVGA